MKLRSIALITFLLICTSCLFSDAPQQSLRDAISKGDLKAVRQLLDENPEYANATIGMNVKGRRAYEISALCFALRINQPEIAKLLLSAGADPTKNTDSRSLLCYAARGGDTSLILLLIQKGVDPNVDPNIKGQKTFGMPRLPLSQVKDIKTAQALIDNGADVNAQASNGQTPLHHLAAYGSNDVILFLIEHGADVNAKDNRGYTPLHKVSQDCRTEKVQLLIDNGADVNALNNNGKNALKQTIEWHAFSRFGLAGVSYYDTLKILIENGSEADVGDVVIAGDLDRLKEILKENPELIHTSKFYRKPLLSIAAAHGHNNIVKYLIEQGADVQIAGPFDNPLLHWAVFAGNPEIIKILLNEGLDVNQKGRHGELPLHWVSKMPNSHDNRRECYYDQIAQILIDAGSELDTKATQAWISMDTGIDTEEPIDQVSHYLRNLEVSGPNSQTQVMAPPALAFDVGDTPLHSAARWGRIEIVNMLIEAGALIDPKNALNQTPLHYAVVYQHPEVVKVLLKAGADPTIKTNKEMDAFQFAETIGDSAIISLLKEKKL